MTCTARPSRTRCRPGWARAASRSFRRRRDSYAGRRVIDADDDCRTTDRRHRESGELESWKGPGHGAPFATRDFKLLGGVTCAPDGEHFYGQPCARQGRRIPDSGTPSTRARARVLMQGAGVRSLSPDQSRIALQERSGRITVAVAAVVVRTSRPTRVRALAGDTGRKRGTIRAKKWLEAPTRSTSVPSRTANHLRLPKETANPARRPFRGARLFPRGRAVGSPARCSKRSRQSSVSTDGSGRPRVPVIPALVPGRHSGMMYWGLPSVEGAGRVARAIARASIPRRSLSPARLRLRRAVRNPPSAGTAETRSRGRPILSNSSGLGKREPRHGRHRARRQTGL